MKDVIDLLLGPGGLTVGLVLAMVGGWRGWWVFGWQYDDAVKERDEWKDAALRGTRVAERVATVASKGGGNVSEKA